MSTESPRRNFLNAAGACSLAAMLGHGATEVSAASEKPNIMLVMADDQG